MINGEKNQGGKNAEVAASEKIRCIKIKQADNDNMGAENHCP